MFVDYYNILELNPFATSEEIKSAFRQQATKWHPDRNLGRDTTERMQEINEAYLILKDIEARGRYDIEYTIFQQYKRNKEIVEQQTQDHSAKKENEYQYADYNVFDDILQKWMNNAKKQAVDLAKQTIEDFKGMVSEGAKAAGTAFVIYLIIGLILTVIFGISKSCS